MSKKWMSTSDQLARLEAILSKNIEELEEFLGYLPGDSEDQSLDVCAIPEDFFDNQEEE